MQLSSTDPTPALLPPVLPKRRLESARQTAFKAAILAAIVTTMLAWWWILVIGFKLMVLAIIDAII